MSTSRVERFSLPDLGEGLPEGEILRWLVEVGDVIALNQPVVEVETAKAAVEIPAKWAGRVVEIFHGVGETVAVGTPIIAIETSPAAGEPTGGRTPVLVGYGPRPANGSTPRRARTGRAAAAPAEPPAVPAKPPAVPAKPPAVPTEPPAVLAKPPVRKLARELGVELREVPGTGPRGSITREDVLGARSRRAQPDGGGVTGDGWRPDPAGHVASDGAGERRIPVRGVRKRAAENLVASAFTAPHVTEFLTVDVTRSLRMLARLRAMPQWQGVRVSPLLIAAKAVLAALRRHPLVNSSWAGDEIVVHGHVNLGIAVASERGLVVPSLKHADRLSTMDLAEAMGAMVDAARNGRASPSDLAGGTFTITNIGVFGVDAGTPILPPGEAAILALGAVREAAWVHNGKIKVRKVTTLGLSFDHRIIDGELGSRFLRDVGDFLEDPAVHLLAWG